MGSYYYPQYRIMGFMWVNFTDYLDNDIKYYSEIDAENYIRIKE